jgi:hypothetical protein
MDHDTGFAPHVSGKVCTLCGCKKKTVEAWAGPGSWVIGIGGKGTGKPDTLIYALRVEANPTLAEFRRQSPRHAAYLLGHLLKASSKVLVAHHFYYLGNNAVSLPSDLVHLMIRARGCRTAVDSDVARLDVYLAGLFGPGAHGKPNNLSRELSKRCGCGFKISTRKNKYAGRRQNN